MRPIPFGERLHRVGLVLDLLRLSATESVDDMSPLVHPEMRMLAAPGLAPGGKYETREDFLDYFRHAQAHGVLAEPDVYEVRVDASGAVVVAGSVRVSTADGIDEIPAWYVYTFRDHLIASLETHLDPELAAQAAAAGYAPVASGECSTTSASPSQTSRTPSASTALS